MAITDLVEYRIKASGGRPTRYRWESPETGLEWRWAGRGHTVGIYSGGHEVDVMTSGSQARNNATHAEVVAHIRQYLRDGRDSGEFRNKDGTHITVEKTGSTNPIRFAVRSHTGDSRGTIGYVYKGALHWHAQTEYRGLIGDYPTKEQAVAAVVANSGRSRRKSSSRTADRAARRAGKR